MVFGKLLKNSGKEVLLLFCVVDSICVAVAAGCCGRVGFRSKVSMGVVIMSVAAANVVRGARVSVPSTRGVDGVQDYVAACLLLNELAAEMKRLEAIAKANETAALEWVSQHPAAAVAADGSRTLQVKHDGELRVISTGVKVKAKIVGDAAEVLQWCRQAGVKLSVQAPEYLHSSTLASAVKSGVVAEGNPLFQLVSETTIAVK